MNPSRRQIRVIAAAIIAVVSAGWVVNGWGLAMFLRFYTPPPCERPPTAPSNLTVTRISANRVDLRWDDNASDELGFEIWRWPDGIVWEDLNSRVGSDIVTYSDTQATIDYWYWVRAWNSCGSSSHAVYRPIIVAPAPEPSSTPMQLIVISPSPAVPAVPANSPTPTPLALPDDTPTLMALVDSISIYSGPGTQYDRLHMELNQGDIVQIIGRLPGPAWWRIACPQASGESECWVTGYATETTLAHVERVPIVVPPPTPTAIETNFARTSVPTTELIPTSAPGQSVIVPELNVTASPTSTASIASTATPIVQSSPQSSLMQLLLVVLAIGISLILVLAVGFVVLIARRKDNGQG